MAPEPALGAEDRELLGRVADRVVALRLETPALLLLESTRPVALAASQALVFFEPFLQGWFRLGDYRRFAALVERRDALEALEQMIEARADTRGAGSPRA